MATAAVEYNGSTVLLDEAQWRSDDFPAAQTQRRLAGQRGVVIPSTLQGARIVTITGQIAENDEDTARATLDTIGNILDVNEPKLLKLWTDRQIYAVAEQWTQRPLNNVGTAWDITIPFVCPDPRWQSTTLTTVTASQGTNGQYDQVYSWGLDYDGTAPFDPHLYFTMERTDNTVDFTYYGPNMLTNTRFELGEDADDDGVPDGWVGFTYGAAAEQRYSFTDPHACIILNSTTGPENGALYQEVPFTEAGIEISCRFEFLVLKSTDPNDTIRLYLREQNVSDDTYDLIGSAVDMVKGVDWEVGTWYTIEMEDATTTTGDGGEGIKQLRMWMMARTANDKEVTVLIRKPAMVRSGTASFPGHFNNRQFTIGVPDSHWLPGEIYEVDCADKEVRYMDANEWQLGWDYFGGDERFFQLDPATPDLHFSWEIDGAVRRTMHYREAFWNA